MSYSNDLLLPSKILLYDEPLLKNFRLNEIGDYIELKTGLNVELREDFLRHYKPKDVDVLAKSLASSKVKSLERREEFEPMHGEINIEKRLLTNPDLKLPGILYDGLQLYKIFQSLIPKDEMSLRNVHIIFTDRLFATFDEDDRRFHARVILCGYPSIISTSGIVEAPAKPRGFYAAKQKLGSVAIEILEAIKEQYKGEFIDYDDERLTEVMKGYAMQALFYHIINEPFCQSKHCRLFNAHWQSELIEAQLRNDRYCVRHNEILEKVKNGAKNR